MSRLTLHLNSDPAELGTMGEFLCTGFVDASDMGLGISTDEEVLVHVPNQSVLYPYSDSTVITRGANGDLYETFYGTAILRGVSVKRRIMCVPR